MDTLALVPRTIHAFHHQRLPVLENSRGYAGYVELVDWMGSDSIIAETARLGTGKAGKTPEDDRRLIHRLMRDWHTSPFEFCDIHLQVRLPVFVCRQWVRHRTANFQEASGRYRILDSEWYLPPPGELRHPHAANRQMSGEALDENAAAHAAEIMTDLSVAAARTYGKLVDPNGPYRLSREQARLVLPLNLFTTIRWKIDVHNLLHFLRLRLAEDAQSEIRAYAQVIAEIVKVWLPMTWSAFEEHRLGAMTLSATDVATLRELLARSVDSLVVPDGEEERFGKLIDRFIEWA